MNEFIGILLVVAFLLGLAKLLRGEEDKRIETERERVLGRPRLRVPLEPRDVLPLDDEEDDRV